MLRGALHFFDLTLNTSALELLHDLGFEHKRLRIEDAFA
jgi:hypothetical protein